MPAFWVIFWLAGLLLPLLIWLTTKIFSNDGGYEKDTSHYWASKPSGGKIRDANRREVWEHLNPGKKWEDRHTGCIIFLVIAFVLLFIFFGADLILSFTKTTSLSWFLKISAPILGGLTVGALLGFQSLISSKLQSTFFIVLNTLSFIIMGLMIITAIVLTFLGFSLPLSHHWIWAPVVFSLLLLVFDALVGKSQHKQAEKRQAAAAEKGGALELWVIKLFEKVFYDGPERDLINRLFSDSFQGVSLGKDFYLANLNVALDKLRQGEMFYLKTDDGFFEDTEALMLDLVGGRPMSISNSDIYAVRQEVVQALQAYYFYLVDISPKHQIHPRIEAALKK